MDVIPRMPIVDSGPLFDFLLLRYSEEHHCYNLLSEFRYLTSKYLRDATRWYFSIAKPLITCPEVIKEVDNLAQRKGLKHTRLGDFWRVAQRELAGLGLDEELVKLVQMDSNTLCSFGPADTALIHMANKHRERNCPIFTEDGPLHQYCSTEEIKVIRLYDVIDLWQRWGSKA